MASVFVSGFGESVMEDDLRAHMEQMGPVDTVQIMPPSVRIARSGSSNSHGRAKVTFASRSDAVRACTELDGQAMLVHVGDVYEEDYDSYDLRIEPFRGGPLANRWQLEQQPADKQEAGVAADPPPLAQKDLKLLASWRKTEAWSEADVRAMLEPNHGEVKAIVMGGGRHHRGHPNFANVWLRRASAELVAKMEEGTWQQSHRIECDGWSLWVQRWREIEGFSWGRTSARASSSSSSSSTTADTFTSLKLEALPTTHLGTTFLQSKELASRSIFCTHFPFQTTAGEVRAMCECIDEVDKVSFLPKQPELSVGGQAVVTFRHKWAVMLALVDLSTARICGRPVRVSRCQPNVLVHDSSALSSALSAVSSGQSTARSAAGVEDNEAGHRANNESNSTSASLDDDGLTAVSNGDVEVAILVVTRLLKSIGESTGDATERVSQLVSQMYRHPEHGEASKRALSSGPLRFFAHHRVRSGFEILNSQGRPLEPGAPTMGNESLRLKSFRATAAAQGRSPAAAAPAAAQTLPPPAPAPPVPPAPSSQAAEAAGIRVGGNADSVNREETLIQKVDRIGATLGLPAELTIPERLSRANRMMGNYDAIGSDQPLPEMAARLLQQLGV
jgi:hypothetical protein